LTRPRILIVDDSAFGRRLIEGILAPRGDDLELAASLAEAREKLRSQRFDLILLDLVLDDGEGGELLSEIRADPMHVDTRVLAVTASSAAPSCEPGQGFDGYVQKPLRTDSLRAAVERWLGPAGEPKTDAFEQRLAILREGFVRELDTLLAELGECVRAACRAPHDAARVSAARTVSHRLIGSAGSYGFASLSEHCRTLEKLFRRLERADDAEKTRLLDSIDTELTGALQAGTPSR
jgi:CheY-like chemotaxis protein/HPt (histidine-containing phosphotransfer) domain-containing protein